MAPSPAAPAPTVVSQCPSCAATYAVPFERMGAAGDRIRCPRCERVYDLKRPGDARPSGMEPTRTRPAPFAGAGEPEPDLGDSADVAARIAVEEIGDVRSREMAVADGDGALFARHGADLLAAFDRYRARAGAQAPAAIFLRALRERLGIDLPPWEGSA